MRLLSLLVLTAFVTVLSSALSTMDWQGLYQVVTALCGTNSLGSFGSCCKASLSAAGTVGNMPSCFASFNNPVTSLFVSFLLFLFVSEGHTLV